MNPTIRRILFRTRNALFVLVSLCLVLPLPARAQLMMEDAGLNGGGAGMDPDFDANQDDDGGFVRQEREITIINNPPGGGGDDTPDYETAPKANDLSLERSLLYRLPTGPWSRTSFNAAKPLTLQTGGLATVNASDQAEVKLNGLEAWTKKVVPVLAEQNGLDHVFISEELSSGMLQAQDWFSGNWKDCVEYEVEADITIELPLDSNDVTAEFAKSKKLKTEWDVDDAYLAVTVRTHLENGPNSGNVFCAGWNLLNLFVGTTSSTVSSENFAGSLDVTLSEVVNSVVSVNDIDAITLEFSDITLLNSDALTWLVDAFLAAGDSVADMFGGGLSCNDVDECVSDLATDQVQKDDTKDVIVSAVNDAIEYTATVEGAENAGDFTIDYAVALPSFSTTNSNTMKTKWDVEISTDGAQDPCAADLRQGVYFETDAALTDDDIDVKIPFPLIDKAVYEIGQKGKFCETVSGTAPGPIALPITGDIVPNGALKISPAASIMSPFEVRAQQVGYGAGIRQNQFQFAGARQAAAQPNLGGVQIVGNAAEADEEGGEAAEDDDDATKLYVTVPAKLVNITVGGHALTGQELYVDIEVEGKIGVNCADGLYVEFTRAESGDITGTLSAPTGLAYGEDDVRDAVNDAIDDMEEDLQGKIPMVPKVNNLAETGELGVEIGTVNIDDAGMHVGLNIVSGDVCAGEEGDDTYVPPVGGGDDTPDPDFNHILEFEEYEHVWDNGGAAGGHDVGGFNSGAAQMQGMGI